MAERNSLSFTDSKEHKQRVIVLPDPATSTRKPPLRAIEVEPLLCAEDVAQWLGVSTDWVWDHSSRKKPLLPVIRMGDGTLRYKPSGIEAFIEERERLSAMRRRA